MLQWKPMETRNNGDQKTMGNEKTMETRKPWNDKTMETRKPWKRENNGNWKRQNNVNEKTIETRKQLKRDNIREWNMRKLKHVGISIRIHFDMLPSTHVFICACFIPTCFHLHRFSSHQASNCACFHAHVAFQLRLFSRGRAGPAWPQKSNTFCAEVLSLYR